MREHVDAPIAPAKERAHYPADDADNNRAPERAPKAGDLKTWHYLANEFQHQRIDNQNKHAQRDENQWEA